MVNWPRADVMALQAYAIENGMSLPNDLTMRAKRVFPNGWAVALSVNR